MLFAALLACAAALALALPSLGFFPPPCADAACSDPWVVWSPELPNGDYPDEICATWFDEENHLADFSTVQNFEWCYESTPMLAWVDFDEGGTSDNIQSVNFVPAYWNPGGTSGGQQVTYTGRIYTQGTNQGYLTIEGTAWYPTRTDTKGITIHFPDDCPW